MTEQPVQTSKSTRPSACVVLILIAVGLLILGALGSSVLKGINTAVHGPPTSTPTTSPFEGSWSACTLFIERQLGISFLDAQRYNPAGVTALSENEFRVRVYYAKNNAMYQCEILRRADGNWQLTGLEVLP